MDGEIETATRSSSDMFNTADWLALHDHAERHLDAVLAHFVAEDAEVLAKLPIALAGEIDPEAVADALARVESLTSAITTRCAPAT